MVKTLDIDRLLSCRKIYRKLIIKGVAPFGPEVENAERTKANHINQRLGAYDTKIKNQVTFTGHFPMNSVSIQSHIKTDFSPSRPLLKYHTQYPRTTRPKAHPLRQTPGS